MHYHIILTEACNLQCKYCYEKSLSEFDNGLEKKFTFDYSEPCNTKVETQKLKEFLSKDENPTLIFYGGEPLLKIEKIKEIIDALSPTTYNLQPTTSKGVAFRMQTNGQLLDKLKPKYLNQITKILISIDGNEQVTDSYRGKGTYKKIIQNISIMKKNGYSGELIARMTVAQDNPNIYENVQDILSIKSAEEPRNKKEADTPTPQNPHTPMNQVFDSIHWQLDANFYKEDFNQEKIKKFFDEYNSSISKLISWWTQEIQKGKTYRLYPFIGITQDLLLEANGQKPKAVLKCGAGHSGYAITTTGKITACPIMNSIKDFECGNLDSNPKDLKKITPIKPCATCEEKSICGGRCLYSNHAKLWGKEGEKLVCDVTKFLIKELRRVLPKIKQAINKKTISESDFEYEKYFGPEIIP